MTQAELDAIIRKLRNSPYGGTWSNDGGGGTISYYSDDTDVFYGGVEAIDKSGGWASTKYGNFDGSALAFHMATKLPIPLRPVNILETRMNE